MGYQQVEEIRLRLVSLEPLLQLFAQVLSSLEILTQIPVGFPFPFPYVSVLLAALVSCVAEENVGLEKNNCYSEQFKKITRFESWTNSEPAEGVLVEEELVGRESDLSKLVLNAKLTSSEVAIGRDRSKKGS